MIPYVLRRGTMSIHENQRTMSEATAWPTAPVDVLHALIAAHLSDPRSAWSLGTFGAVAEFQYDIDETVAYEGLRAVTARGGIAVELPHGVVPVAYERSIAHGLAHGVAFCLPRERARGSGRRVLTELGPDPGALREADRDAVLFDLGLGTTQCDCLVRVRAPQAVKRLRAACGAALLDGDAVVLGELAAMNPQRVFVSPLGRIEVFQPIPAPGGVSPEGPHTHVLPRLLKSRRTHPATLPVPDGLVPCLELHTPDSVRNAFDAWRAGLPMQPAGR
jgi:Family of unknown function (DUF6925)